MSPINANAPFGSLLAAALLSAAGAASASGGPATTPPAVSGETRVLASVDGQVITEEQVLRRLKVVDPHIEARRDEPKRWARLLDSATEAEIRDQLLLHAARAEGLEVPPEEVSAALARSRALLGAEGYANMLARQGASEADYSRFLSERLLIEKYRSRITKDVTVDEETLRNYYRGHKESLRAPARARLEVAELADAALAERVAVHLRGGESLDALSDLDPSIRLKDGRWISERDLPPLLRKEVEAAAPNQVLGPIESAGTYRIIRVRERQPSRKLSYQESEDLIRKRLLQDREQAALDAWHQQAKREAQIEYR